MTNRHVLAAALLGALVGGCAGGSTIPAERLASAQASVKAAEAAGAAANPRAAMHLELAHAALRDARRLVALGEEEAAKHLLLRAQADAELSLALARELAAVSEARAAIEQAHAMHERLR